MIIPKALLKLMIFNMGKTTTLLNKLSQKHIWDEEPVYCITTDIDWASEDVLNLFFNEIEKYQFNLDIFTTHNSKVIDQRTQSSRYTLYPHPNFCENSSHGGNKQEVIDFITNFVPNAKGVRMHRYGTEGMIEYELKDKYNYNFISNVVEFLSPNIKPSISPSGMVSFPIFFEDGIYLKQKMDLDFSKNKHWFKTKGLKIINFHPIDFVLNSPSHDYMRKVRDSVSREEYNNLTLDTINELKNKKRGIHDFVVDILDFIKKNDYITLSLNQLYNSI